MSLIAGDYSPNFCRGMIHKQEKRQFQHSRIDPDSVYLSDAALVRRMEGPMCHQDALSEYYNVDAKWIAEDVFQQGNFPSMAFRYSSILSNCLLKRIKRMENLVGRLRFY